VRSLRKGGVETTGKNSPTMWMEHFKFTGEGRNVRKTVVKNLFIAARGIAETLGVAGVITEPVERGRGSAGPLIWCKETEGFNR